MIAQGSEAWFLQRLGKATASRIADVIAKTKSGYSTSRENYRVELALERITGQRQESYTNGAMQWGTDTEPLARAAYEAHTGTSWMKCRCCLTRRLPCLEPRLMAWWTKTGRLR